MFFLFLFFGSPYWEAWICHSRSKLTMSRLYWLHSLTLTQSETTTKHHASLTHSCTHNRRKMQQEHFWHRFSPNKTSMRAPLPERERERNWKSVHYLSSFKTTLSLWEREIIIDTAREWQMELLALCARFHSFAPASDSPRDARLLSKYERDAGAGMRLFLANPIVHQFAAREFGAATSYVCARAKMSSFNL